MEKLKFKSMKKYLKKQLAEASLDNFSVDILKRKVNDQDQMDQLYGEYGWTGDEAAFEYEYNHYRNFSNLRSCNLFQYKKKALLVYVKYPFGKDGHDYLSLLITKDKLGFVEFVGCDHYDLSEIYFRTEESNVQEFKVFVDEITQKRECL